MFEGVKMFLDIKRTLGTPYYESDNCLIYNTDSLTLLSKIPQESINLTITSPPYNIGKSYESILPVDEYINWCTKWTVSYTHLRAHETS